MARRNNSLRRSTNDVFHDDNSPFKTMYSQQFVDPAQRVITKSKNT